MSTFGNVTIYLDFYIFEGVPWAKRKIKNSGIWFVFVKSFSMSIAYKWYFNCCDVNVLFQGTDNKNDLHFIQQMFDVDCKLCGINKFFPPRQWFNDMGC